MFFTNRLTAEEFLESLRGSESGWIGTVDYIPGIVLVLPDEAGKGEMIYLGPDPFEEDLNEYRRFAEEAMRIVMARAEKRKKES